jgi:hypothetical protein
VSSIEQQHDSGVSPDNDLYPAYLTTEATDNERIPISGERIVIVLGGRRRGSSNRAIDRAEKEPMPTRPDRNVCHLRTGDGSTQDSHDSYSRD